MKKKQPKERPVLVTTAHRGVFMGWATDTDGDTIFLRRGRMCVYWSVDMKGVLGLAERGPSEDCRIGPAVDLTVRNITAVVEVTPEAAQKWEEQPWQR